MNNEEHKRFKEQLGRIGKACFSLSFLHACVHGFEKDPNKPFSLAICYSTFGYVVFQLADAYAFAKNHPSYVVFDGISIFCGLSAIFLAIAFACIFVNFTFN